MNYECFGEAKRLAIAAYEEGKQWNNLVVDTIRKLGVENCEKYIKTGAIDDGCWVIGIVCDADISSKGWRKHRLPYYWVPDKRFKKGKENAEIIDSIPVKPRKAMNALLGYLGFQDGRIELEKKVAIRGIKIRDGHVFLQCPYWDDLRHREIKEVTNAVYRGES